MLKWLTISLPITVLLLGLMGCDQKTRPEITTKVDKTLEKMRVEIDTMAKQSIPLQPIGQASIQVIDQTHQITHGLIDKSTTTQTGSSSPNKP